MVVAGLVFRLRMNLPVMAEPLALAVPVTVMVSGMCTMVCEPWKENLPFTLIEPTEKIIVLMLMNAPESLPVLLSELKTNSTGSLVGEEPMVPEKRPS